MTRRAADQPTDSALGFDTHMQLWPIRRLTDGALSAVEVQVRGPLRSKFADHHELKRIAAMMDQQVAVDGERLRWAGGPEVRNLAAQLPLLSAVDVVSLADPSIRTAVEQAPYPVVTVTADAFFSHPAATMDRVNQARAHGWLICLRDIGIDERILSMVSLVEPELLVTSREILRPGRSAQAADAAHGIVAHCERSNAVVIAEGVDSDEDRRDALTFGATYGTGKLYPRVAPGIDLSRERLARIPPLPVWSIPAVEQDSPFAVASQHFTARPGTKRSLISMSKSLERRAAQSGPSTIVLGTFQYAEHFTQRTAARWGEMAQSVGFAGVYGVGMSPVLLDRVQQAPLVDDDPLVGQWNVIVLSPHFCALLTANDLNRGADEDSREFEFIETFDRTTVVRAMNTVLARFGR